MSRHLRLIRWRDGAGRTQELKLYELLGSEWTEVADLVGISIPAVNTIRKNNREVGDCIRSVMDRWIQDALNMQSYPCTWNGMRKLLNNIRRTAASKELRKALEADMSTLKRNFSAGEPLLLVSSIWI